MREGLPAMIVHPCTVYGPRCNDIAGKVFSRPSAITAIPGHGKQLLSNIRAEDVWHAYDTQVSHFIGQMVKGIGCLDASRQIS